MSDKKKYKDYKGTEVGNPPDADEDTKAKKAALKKLMKMRKGS